LSTKFNQKSGWDFVKQHDLHKLMTEEELAFYLGVVSATATAPEYQVVFLSPALTLEGSHTDGSGDVEELRYDFTAFNT
jgi:hypothetical protein